MENAFLKLSYSVPGPGLGAEAVMTDTRGPYGLVEGIVDTIPCIGRVRPGQGRVHRPGSHPSWGQRKGLGEDLAEQLTCEAGFRQWPGVYHLEKSGMSSEVSSSFPKAFVKSCMQMRT